MDELLKQIDGAIEESRRLGGHYSPDSRWGRYYEGRISGLVDVKAMLEFELKRQKEGSSC